MLFLARVKWKRLKSVALSVPVKDAPAFFGTLDHSGGMRDATWERRAGIAKMSGRSPHLALGPLACLTPGKSREGTQLAGERGRTLAEG